MSNDYEWTSDYEWTAAGECAQDAVPVMALSEGESDDHEPRVVRRLGPYLWTNVLGSIVPAALHPHRYRPLTPAEWDDLVRLFPDSVPVIPPVDLRLTLHAVSEHAIDGAGEPSPEHIAAAIAEVGTAGSPFTKALDRLWFAFDDLCVDVYNRALDLAQAAE
jgi:hypothetical protein